MEPNMFYGMLVGVVMALAWIDGHRVGLMLAGALFTAWAASNVAATLLGLDHAPLVIPTIHAVLAICVAIVGIAYRSRAAASVFGLYLLMTLCDVGSFIARVDGSFAYYLTINALFCLQLLVVGGESAWGIIWAWSARSRERLRIDVARRQIMAARSLL